MTTSDAALRGAGLHGGVKNVPVLLVTCTSRAMNRSVSSPSLSLSVSVCVYVCLAEMHH